MVSSFVFQKTMHRVFSRSIVTIANVTVKRKTPHLQDMVCYNFIRSNLNQSFSGAMKLYYCSDLHSEFYARQVDVENLVLSTTTNNVCMNHIDKDKDVLILAGDIGVATDKNNLQKLETVFQTYQKYFQHIVFVPGNHCYYGIKQKNQSLEQIDQCLEKLCQENKVNFLQAEQKEPVIINNTMFIGCTLWSYITNEAFSQMTDSRTVFKDVNQYRELNRKHTEYLVKKLEENKLSTKYPVVVVTHHLPSFSLIHPIYKGSSLNSAFANHLNSLIKNSNEQIKLWVCGHTHAPMKVKVENVPVLVNPFGYPDENHNVKVECIEI